MKAGTSARSTRLTSVYHLVEGEARCRSSLLDPAFHVYNSMVIIQLPQWAIYYLSPAESGSHRFLGF
jgi:hypothetical protein